MRNAKCEASFVERLGLRLLLLSFESPLELFGADRPHDRENLAQPARMTARFIEALPLERFGKLLVAEDPFVDEVLAQRLDGRRLAENAPEGVDEVDRAEWLDEVMGGARGESRFAVGRAVACRPHHDRGRVRRRVALRAV